MSTPQEIEAGVFEEIANELKIEAAELRADTKISELEASSLSVMEIIFAIEERFNIELPYSANDLAGLQSLGQIVEAVENTLQSNAKTA